MKTRLLTITLAVVLAVAGLVAVLGYVHQANERAVNGLKAESVMVATSPIPAGTSLILAQQEHLLGTEKVPDSSFSTSSSSTSPVQSVIAANEHLVMSSAVAQGQVLLQNMLVSSTAVSAIPSIIIPTGMEAVTIQLCASEAIANYLAAGSVVMVFATVPTSSNVTVQRSCDVSHAGVPTGGASTKEVLSNVKVLAVADALPSSSSTSSGSSSAVADPVSASLSSDLVAVTFAVTPAQALQLIEVAQVELPYLALLPTG